MSSSEKVVKSDAEWRSELDADAYAVLRQGATEPPFTGRYARSKDDGTYLCGGCGTPLFSSDTKFESGTGWPSFTEGQNIETKTDTSHGMVRTEVVCGTCGGHLGHLFDDGPRDQGGLRYCINSAALDLKPE